MIYRGATTTQYFRFPYTWADVDKVYISYYQNGNIVLEKNKDQMSYDSTSKCIYVTLDQMDTLTFSQSGIPADPSRSLVYIQLRVLLSNGVAYSCDPIKERVCSVIKEDYITNTPSGGDIVYDGGTV